MSTIKTFNNPSRIGTTNFSKLSPGDIFEDPTSTGLWIKTDSVEGTAISIDSGEVEYFEDDELVTKISKMTFDYEY